MSEKLKPINLSMEELKKTIVDYLILTCEKQYEELNYYAREVI